MVQTTYLFSAWLLCLLVSAKITVPNPYDVHIELRTARVVPDSNLIFRHTIEGNLNAVIELIEKGQASAHNVDENNGTSALMVCKGSPLITTYSRTKPSRQHELVQLIRVNLVLVKC